MEKNLLNEVNRYREILGLELLEEQETNKRAEFRFKLGGGLIFKISDNGDGNTLEVANDTSGPKKYTDIGNARSVVYDITTDTAVGEGSEGYKNYQIANDVQFNRDKYPSQKPCKRGSAGQAAFAGSTALYTGKSFYVLDIPQNRKNPNIKVPVIRLLCLKKSATEMGTGLPQRRRVDSPQIRYGQFWCEKGKKGKGKGCYFLEPNGMGPRADQYGPAQRQVRRPIEIQFRIGNPFVFNSVDFLPEGQTQFDKKIKELNDIFEKQPDYKEFLKQNPINILGFSSRDDDPEGPRPSQGWPFSPCSNRAKRKDYNLCLSQKRAERVAELLSSQYPDLKFDPKGMGENCDSGNCWKPGKKNHDSKETAMDRRFEVRLPKYRN